MPELTANELEKWFSPQSQRVSTSLFICLHLGSPCLFSSSSYTNPFTALLTTALSPLVRLFFHSLSSFFRLTLPSSRLLRRHDPMSTRSFRRVYPVFPLHHLQYLLTRLFSFFSWLRITTTTTTTTRLYPRVTSVWKA